MNKVFVRGEIAKLKLVNRTSKIATIAESRIVKEQNLIEIANLKNAK